jgi:hypothetical protein
MASETRATTDHEEIRSWVEDHDGRPATIRGTANDDQPRSLRFHFPGGAGHDKLENISWDEWFSAFDDSKLSLLYCEHQAGVMDSTFFQLVSKDKQLA